MKPRRVKVKPYPAVRAYAKVDSFEPCPGILVYDNFAMIARKRDADCLKPSGEWNKTIAVVILDSRDYRDLLRDAKAWRASNAHEADCCGTIGGHCDCLAKKGKARR